MNQLFENSLLIISCGYYLLIAYGVVKLPQRGQQKFDQYSSRKKTLLLLAAYIIIAWAAYSIIRDLSS